MKKTISCLFLMLLLGMTTYAQRTASGTSTNRKGLYYYSGITKISPTLNTKSAYIFSEDKNVLENLGKNGGFIVNEIKEDKQVTNKIGYFAELTWSDELSSDAYLKIIGDFKKNELLYISPCFIINGKKKQLSNYLNVKLKDESDLDLLHTMAREYRMTFVDHGRYYPKRWVNMRCDPGCSMNAMEMAAFLYETGKFETVLPDMTQENAELCATDPFFNLSWGLLNTGQYGGTAGVDINICDAWNITQGSSAVKVSVIDGGIQDAHWDLGNVDISDHFNPVDPNVITLYGNGHGTACAGIIAARKNNNLPAGDGSAGVAPDCKLMSVSVELLNSNSNRLSQIAAGIVWSYLNGASVINNSWGEKSDNFGDYQYVTDAINEAINLGRNELGCVVVCSSGNVFPDPIDFPAYLSNVIAVGAITPCGQRKSNTSCGGENWWSQYGPELDIMAPGVNIFTTDLMGETEGFNRNTTPTDLADKDYTAKFPGTSAAAPFVSGVAALMLSVNPCLTEKNVRNIIEITAQKLGGYSYSSYLNKPSGAWHQEMGYGVLDAYKAVKAAQDLHSTTLDLYVKDAPEDFGAEPAAYPHNMIYASPDIWTRNNPDGVEQQEDIIVDPANLSPMGYVYVRVRNKSCVPSLGTEQLNVYFAKGGTFASWPAPWTNTTGTPPLGGQIGTVTLPIIQPGQEYIARVAWYNVPNPQNYGGLSDIHNFCLLTRIVAANDPMYMELTYAGSISILKNNLKNNNNIAMKNINVVDFQRRNGLLLDHSTITIGNYSTTRQIQRIHFFTPESEMGNQIFQEAEITLTLDDHIWDLWLAGGKQANGIRVADEGKHELQITDPDATLENLSFEADEIGDIALRFNFLTEISSNKTDFLYDVTQEDNTSGEMSNGSRFHIIKPVREEEALFESSLNNQGMTMLNSVALSATDIQEPATYRWLNADSSLVDSGMNISVNAGQVVPTLLEVTAEVDGYKDYTSINIPGTNGTNNQATDSLISLTPNPASGQVTLQYNLSIATQSAEVRFTTVNNPAVLQVATLDITQSQQTVQIPGLSPGIYVVSLYADGVLKNSKQLVVQ